MASAPSLREVWAAPLRGVANAQPLALAGAGHGAPTVANGRLKVPAWNERLHAYAP